MDNIIPQAPQLRVLIVDDNVDAADMLASLLTLSGCAVNVAYSGIEALALGELLRPQFVILDIAMPGMDGYETARRIRERPWGRQARIAALTAWGDEDVRRRTVQACMDFHFAKPVAARVLLDVLSSGRA